jgi:hypothetical protein
MLLKIELGWAAEMSVSKNAGTSAIPSLRPNWRAASLEGFFPPAYTTLLRISR